MGGGGARGSPSPASGAFRTRESLGAGGGEVRGTPLREMTVQKAVVVKPEPLTEQEDVEFLASRPGLSTSRVQAEQRGRPSSSRQEEQEEVGELEEEEMPTASQAIRSHLASSREGTIARGGGAFKQPCKDVVMDIVERPKAKGRYVSSPDPPSSLSVTEGTDVVLFASGSIRLDRERSS